VTAISVFGRSACSLPLFLILCFSARAQTAIDELAWLSGSWQSVSQTGSEEHWTTPAGGMMLGVHRDVRGEQTFFEYLRIEQMGDSVLYVASPMGTGETHFPLVRVRKGFARFENPRHDYPARIEYERTATDELTARISDADGRKERSWVFRRKEQGLR